MTTFRKAEIHVGDIGTTWELTAKDGDSVVVDISTATVKQLVFRKPDGTTLEVTADFKTDGSDGILTYSSVAGNLDQAGEWQVQGYTDMPAWDGHWSVEVFNVYPNLRTWPATP